VSLLFAVSPALPLGKAGKYVAAAYIVVFVVILVYVAIMAVRAQRTQRELDELRRDVEALKAARAELDDEPDDGLGRPGSGRSARSEQIA
jgi:CcmD family protein